MNMKRLAQLNFFTENIETTENESFGGSCWSLQLFFSREKRHQLPVYNAQKNKRSTVIYAMKFNAIDISFTLKVIWL